MRTPSSDTAQTHAGGVGLLPTPSATGRRTLWDLPATGPVESQCTGMSVVDAQLAHFSEDSQGHHGVILSDLSNGGIVSDLSNGGILSDLSTGTFSQLGRSGVSSEVPISSPSVSSLTESNHSTSNSSSSEGNDSQNEFQETDSESGGCSEIFEDLRYFFKWLAVLAEYTGTVSMLSIIFIEIWRCWLNVQHRQRKSVI